LSEKIEKNQREKEMNEKRDEIEEKRARESYLAAVGEVRRFSQKSIFVLMYNGGFLVSNYNNLALPSVFQSLLQEFEDMFKIKEYLPLEVLNIK